MSTTRTAAFEDTMAGAVAAVRAKDWDAAWPYLERAHVLSQPRALDHVRVHVWMLVVGFGQRDLREVVGQIGRLLVAGPASVVGRYPRGNTGRANVSAFVPMAVSREIEAILDRE